MLRSVASGLGLQYVPKSHKIGPVHFRLKGCLVLCFVIIQILMEHSINKQWRP